MSQSAQQLASFDLHRESYGLLNGAEALRALADELAQHSSDEPLQGRDRDHLMFVLSAMAEKADACASAWIDQIEASRDG